MTENTEVRTSHTGTTRVKRGLADMLKGGVIMDVVTPDQARIAEDSGASAVMALERVPADIRAQGGVARMSDPELIEAIKDAVEKLNAESQEMGKAIYEAEAASGAEGAAATDDPNVVDAEVVDEDTSAEDDKK